MRSPLLFLLLTFTPFALAQTASSIKLGYPNGGYVDIQTDDRYCLVAVSVDLRGVHIERQKIERRYCNLHLQETTVGGESSINLLTGEGGFRWEIDIPYGVSDENFSEVKGRYRLILGEHCIERIDVLPNNK